MAANTLATVELALRLTIGILVILQGEAGFCDNGRAWPSFLQDRNGTTAEVYLLEAPLFSINPSVGPVPGEVLRAYHVALFFNLSDGSNYTLEYDAKENVVAASVPVIEANGSLTWHNQAAWCLREGLLYAGLDHWIKDFAHVGGLTGTDFLAIGKKFISVANNSDPKVNIYGLAEYSATQVFDGDHKVLFHDCTCATGIMSLLAHITQCYNKTFGQALLRERTISSTHMSIYAHNISKVNMSDMADAADVRDFYAMLHNMSSSGPPILQRMHDFLKMAQDFRYVYREGQYYTINAAPVGIFGRDISIEYKPVPFGIYARGGLGLPWVHPSVRDWALYE